MTKEIDNGAIERGGWLSSCLMWFFWGGSMSFMAVVSLALLILLAASVSLNVYLGWRLSGLEVAISRPAAEPVQLPAFIPTEILAAIPTNTPEFIPTPIETVAPAPTEASAPAPIESPLEAQFATLSALATEVAALRSASGAAPLAAITPTSPPTGVPAAVAPPTSVTTTVAIGGPISPPTTAQPQPDSSAAESSDASALEAPDAASAQVGTTAAATPVPYSALTSSNSYSLIPINGERDQRPAAEHGDLNLKLRAPQPIEVEATLVDAGAGVDPNAPKLGDIFEPNFTTAYAIHNWDWGCNCKGELIEDGQAILVGIETTPGEPIFIPPVENDIYDGKFYATVLYASEDSLTFVYAREGTVAMGYTVHYLGLRTDPNLLQLYQESKGNQLPGLTLDTPVGIATAELLVAMRDNGKFLDARSKNDWWD